MPVNGNFGLLDTITGGITSVAVANGSSTALNAAQLACGTISVSGALTTNATIDFPAVQGWWSIENLTTGSSLLIVRAGTFTQAIGVPPGEITDIQVNGNTVKYRNLGRVGSYIDLAVATVPTWISACNIPPYLICDGSTFSAGTYPYLNTILGGNTLPDLRGRARFYLNGGTNRITTAGSGIDGDTMRSSGGDQSLQSHSHSFTTGAMNSNQSHTHTHNAVASGSTAGSGPSQPPVWTALGPATVNATNIDHTHSGTTSGAGSGGSQNMPPATISGITLIRAG